MTETEIEDFLQKVESGLQEAHHNMLVEKALHYGDNEGLVMAEVELGDEHEAYVKPDFIGMEVTGDKRFYNSHLLSNPFSLWRHTLPEEYR